MHFRVRPTLSALAVLLLFALDLRADLIFFKDGFVLQGRVRRESVTEWDPVGRDLLVIPKGFYMLDDGPRRVYFSPRHARIVEQREPDSEERILRKSDALILLTSANRNMPAIEEVLSTSPWDSEWDRTITWRSGVRRVEVPQHLSSLTPTYARIGATKKYWWVAYYLTKELGPKAVHSLIESHPEFQMDAKLDDTKKLAIRLRASDFYAQAGWFDLAEQQLDLLLAEQPKEKERVEKIRKALNRMRSREAFEEVKHLHNAGQHEAVRVALATFPEEHATDETLADLKELLADYKATEKQLADASRLLGELGNKVEGPHAATLKEAGKVIRGEVHFTNVGRLETFLSQALQEERFARQGKSAGLKPAELVALAVTGWLLNSPSAEANPRVAADLWRARDMILKYLKTPGLDARRDLVTKYQAGLGKGGPRFDELLHMIPLLPPVEPVEVPAGRVVERKADSDRYGELPYHLLLPPEYSPYRRYPVLFVLPRAAQKPADMLAAWQKEAATNGFILAAPEWQEGISRTYTYSDREHETVLATLRDLQRRFQVDSDRVFLFGLGEGGEMAFDVGLTYPDLFAGVLPMGASPNYYSLACWRNGQYLPFYVVHGTRIGQMKKPIRSQFDNWLMRGYPMLWVEYKGRGLEWYKAEVPYMFDWMRDKTRAFPLDQLGTDGFGGALGNEFCVMRQGKYRFYWLEAEDIDARRVNTISRWTNSTRAATLHARIDARSNSIFFKSTGVQRVTIWLGQNRYGEKMIDPERPVTVYGGLRRYWRPGRIQPSLATLLEGLYRRGDRQRLFWAKIELDLSR